MRSQRDRLARIAQEYTDDDRIIIEARGWLLDCFGHDEDAADYIADMSVLDVILAVDRHYVGGWTHFVETATCPFTAEELEEAAAELDEEAIKYRSGVNDRNKKWVAYCTTCKAAIEECPSGYFAEGAARYHVQKHPEHQVIVGQEILGRDYGVCVKP